MHTLMSSVFIKSANAKRLQMLKFALYNFYHIKSNLYVYAHFNAVGEILMVFDPGILLQRKALQAAAVTSFDSGLLHPVRRCYHRV